MGQSVGYSMTAVGGTNGDTQMNQVVPINKTAADATFILSGWGKANSVAGTVTERTTGEEKYFGLIAVVKYTDGTTENHYVSFNDDFNDWQFASGIVVPKQSAKTIDTITVHCAYDYNANRVYFSNISLIQEPVQTYSYDEKGNPVAATDGNAKTAYEYFSGTSKLKNYTTPSGTTHELAYSGNNLVRDTLAGLSQNYAYNSSGSLTQSITRVEYSGPYMASYNSYTDDGQFKTESDDVNAVKTEYKYDGYRMLEQSIKDPDGAEIVQIYKYNTGNDRMRLTYIKDWASINYGYTNGMLTALERGTYWNHDGQSEAMTQFYRLGYDAFGNPLTVSVSGAAPDSPAVTLASYAYESGVNNGRLAQMTYANGDTVNYAYDQFDRKTAETYNDPKTPNDTTTNHYVYASDGSLARQYVTNSDGAALERYSYQYDSLGRLIHSRKLDGTGATVLSTEHLYDTANRLTSQSWQFGSGGAYRQKYTYDTADGTLKTLTNTMPGTSDTITYGYNSLRQLTHKTTSGAASFTRVYNYVGLGPDRQTAQVRNMNYRKADSQDNSTLILGYKYYYDALGNISKVYDNVKQSSTNETPYYAYTYDKLGQLTSATDVDTGYSYSYTYDSAGNIRSMVKTKTATNAKTTTTLSYDNASWPDLLTSVTVGGTTKSITYQTAADGNLTGNPQTWYNGKDWGFTWGKGTQLTSVKKKSNDNTFTYTYDMSGVRDSKTVNGVTYFYKTLSGLVMQQDWINANGKHKTLTFLYDDNNQPYAIINNDGSTATPVLYYYLLNQQGDVMALMNTDATIVARYSYDPWGVPTVLNPDGTKNTTSTFIGNLNPLRYRGYFYDKETGFYYLQSRYYDPAIGRFISADTFATTDCEGFLSANMFAYCENNPVMKEDRDGTAPHIVIGAFYGAIISSAVELGGQLLAGQPLQDVDWAKVGIAAASGAIGGALAATGAGLFRQVIGNAGISAISYVASSAIDGETITADGIVRNAVVGAITGIIGGAGADGKNVTSTLNYVKKGLAREARRVNKKYAAKQIAKYTALRTTTKRGVKIAAARFSLGALFAKWATSRRH